MAPALEKSLVSCREEMLVKITEYFRPLALEAHVFGSIGKNTSDSLSDVDIWITFTDEETPTEIERRFETYDRFGEVVLFHEAQQNFPLNGNYSLVLYKTGAGLLQVDFFFAPLSSSRVGDGSKVFFEKTPIERGEMIYDHKRVKKGPEDRVNFLLCMCFIGVKKIVRKKIQFIDFLVTEYLKLKADSFPQLVNIQNGGDSETLLKVLDGLSVVSDEPQKKAGRAISDFLVKVEVSR
ncbi:MAG TPA: nucleotidyltransferase domain-containing protein [Candidatus Paceibacterota bacterium]|jgi:predicted nucleotidyltransferase